MTVYNSYCGTGIFLWELFLELALDLDLEYLDEDCLEILNEPLDFLAEDLREPLLLPLWLPLLELLWLPASETLELLDILDPLLSESRPIEDGGCCGSSTPSSLKYMSMMLETSG